MAAAAKQAVSYERIGVSHVRPRTDAQQHRCCIRRVRQAAAAAARSTDRQGRTNACHTDASPSCVRRGHASGNSGSMRNAGSGSRCSREQLQLRETQRCVGSGLSAMAAAAAHPAAEAQSQQHAAHGVAVARSRWRRSSMHPMASLHAAHGVTATRQARWCGGRALDSAACVCRRSSVIAAA